MDTGRGGRGERCRQDEEARATASVDVSPCPYDPVAGSAGPVRTTREASNTAMKKRKYWFTDNSSNIIEGTRNRAV
jgi:hypothetical protein